MRYFIAFLVLVIVFIPLIWYRIKLNKNVQNQVSKPLGDNPIIHYRKNGIWHEIYSDDASVYNLITSISLLDIIIFYENVPNLIEKLLSSGEAFVGAHHIKKDGNETFLDDQHNVWSIIKGETEHIKSYIIYKNDEDESLESYWLEMFLLLAAGTFLLNNNLYFFNSFFMISFVYLINIL